MKDKNKAPMNKEIEQQLLPRLKLMGIILMVFSCFTFFYAISLDPPSAIDTPEEMELSSGISLISADRRVNAFGIAGIFSAIGALCILIALRRSKA